MCRVDKDLKEEQICSDDTRTYEFSPAKFEIFIIPSQRKRQAKKITLSLLFVHNMQTHGVDGDLLYHVQKRGYERYGMPSENSLSKKKMFIKLNSKKVSKTRKYRKIS